MLITMLLLALIIIIETVPAVRKQLRHLHNNLNNFQTGKKSKNENNPCIFYKYLN